MSVYEYLCTADRPRTALQISTATGLPKRKVNKTLYHDDRFTKDDSTPPRWSIDDVSEYMFHIYMDDDSKITLIINDLGNVHDISRRIEPYLEKSDGLLQYIAVAEKSYNGHKIEGKTAVVPNGEVLFEINYLFDFYNEQANLGKVIIATKNSMIRKHMKNFFARRHPTIEMDVVSCFNELKEILDS